MAEFPKHTADFALTITGLQKADSLDTPLPIHCSNSKTEQTLTCSPSGRKALSGPSIDTQPSV